MKVSGETRIALILAVIVGAGLAGFILFRKSDEIERVVDTATPSFAAKGSLAGTHWTFRSSNGAAYSLEFENETRAQVRWEDAASTSTGTLDCEVSADTARTSGVKALRLSCPRGGETIEQTVLISEENGQRHATIINAHTGNVWLERLDAKARGNGLRSAEQALYIDEFGKSEPSGSANKCLTRFAVNDMLGKPAKIRVSRYLREGEARPGMKLVGPDYSRREFTAEWTWPTKDKSGDLTGDKPLPLKAGPYTIGPDGMEGDSGYHIEVTGEDGSEIYLVDVYPDRLEYCAANATEMTVLITLAQPDLEAHFDRRISYRYKPTNGCNAFVKVTNEAKSPVGMSVWTNENDGYGGFAGEILSLYDGTELAPGAALWAHGEVPAVFAAASIRSEYGDELAGLNEDWLYPQFGVSVHTTNAGAPDGAGKTCGGGLHFATDIYAPVEQCLRTGGSVFLDMTVTERQFDSGCSLSVDLQ